MMSEGPFGFCCVSPPISRTAAHGNVGLVGTPWLPPMSGSLGIFCPPISCRWQWPPAWLAAPILMTLSNRSPANKNLECLFDGRNALVIDFIMIDLKMIDLRIDDD
jgi:hypothetical protein